MTTYRAYLNERRAATFVELKDKRILQVYPMRSSNIMFRNVNELAATFPNARFDPPLPITRTIIVPTPLATPLATPPAAPAVITFQEKIKTKEYNVASFGRHDYNRLKGMESRDVEKISSVTDPKLIRLAASLKKRIRQGKLYLMDKESGVAFCASGVVGFDGDRLLIFNER